MNDTTLLCPFDRDLLKRLSGRRLMVRVDRVSDIAEAATAARANNSLAGVLCETDVPLTAIEIDETWRGIPVTLSVPAMGKFRDLAGRVRRLRSLGVKVLLPQGERALTDTRVLASLGVPAGILFTTEERPDWETLADFATYALLGPVPHAPMEPFYTLRNAYRPDVRGGGWGWTLYDDPSRYWHLDARGNIALTRADLLAGKFVADSLSALDEPAVREAAATRAEAWRDFFLEEHFCATCPGWKLCQGRFSAGIAEPDGCVEFFCELEDLAEQSLKRRKSNGPKPS